MSLDQDGRAILCTNNRMETRDLEGLEQPRECWKYKVAIQARAYFEAGFEEVTLGSIPICIAKM